MEIKKQFVLNSLRLKDHQSFQILDSLVDLVRVRDKDGSVIYENRALLDYCYRDLGLRRSNLPNYTDAISTKILPLDLSQETLDKGTSVSTQISVNNQAFSVKITPIFDAYDEVIGCIEVLRDITEANNLTVQLFLDNRKIQEEMKLARSLQSSMLPTLTSFGDLRFDYRYVPSDELSGDFFDLIPLGAGRLGLYITDVMGHGISASILTMFVRQSMRNLLEKEKITEPKEVLKNLKDQFTALDLGEGQYFTIFYAVVDVVNQTLTYANAGHNCAPLLQKDGEVVKLLSTGMLISDIFESSDYEQKEISLEKGTQILFFTDGVIETENKEGEDFGFRRLSEIMLHHSDNVLDTVINQIDEFRFGEQKDDVALLLMKTPEE